ncbi:MAG TPA: TonB-dependent receptor [Gemmatimonadales bacterium]|nr:TonB-dependent receptor [Gemmatimonadales bacterium]
MRVLLVSVLCLLVVSTVAAQAPAINDTLHRDSAKVTLPEITVTVTRSPETVIRVPAAIGVVDRHDIQGAQATLNLDEALANLPGVYIANRYNYNLDEQLSIRGAGIRANFGLRGVKVLLDGIPQTLPDGQSQMTNIDYGNISRIEVLRGASSSLYGNASGGVISLTSEGPAPGPFSQSIRSEAGSFGLFKISERTTGRLGAASGVLSVSHTNVDGFRQYSATDFTQLSLAGNYVLGTATNLGLHFGYTDAPQTQNPGALTQAEFFANPDSAAANNILRKANKSVSQGQLALSLTQHTSHGQWDVTVFGVLRNLDNPLATPPPTGPGPNIGTYTTIDRQVGGARLSTVQHLGDGDHAPEITAGVDAQRLRDDRASFRSIAGVPDTSILDQREIVTEVGPFVQFRLTPVQTVVVAVGGRYDAVRFVVEDHHLSDGVDNSGSRTMSAFSGNAGVSWIPDLAFSPYVNVSTSFQTPTTTELVNQPNSTGGFNFSLSPQRTANYELGVRGTFGTTTYTVTGFIDRITDAIVPYQEVSGRAYYTNAGQVKNDGLELGLSGRPLDRLRLFGNYTYSNFRFGAYRLVNGATTTVLDGKRVPGVPKGFIRLGLRAGPVDGFSVDIDHTMATSVYADDQNTLYVDGLGSTPKGQVPGLGNGVTNARLSWEGRAGGAWVRPFLAVNNIWDRRYVGSLTINGSGGRVFEPSPGRNFYIGGEIGWAAAP